MGADVNFDPPPDSSKTSWKQRNQNISLLVCLFWSRYLTKPVGNLARIIFLQIMLLN